MRRTLLLLLSTLMVQGALAQGQYTIQGKITEAGNAIVKNALVTLLQEKDSSIITSVIADKSGNYKLSSQLSANILLKVDANGFIAWYGKPNEHMQQQQMDVVLHKNKMLSEVTVTSRKPVFEQKADRMVFNVENSATA